MPKRRKLYTSLPVLEGLPGWLFKRGIAIITLQLAVFYIVVDQTAQSTPLYAFVHYAPALEYVAASIALLVGGTLWMDYLIKREKQ